MKEGDSSREPSASLRPAATSAGLVLEAASVTKSFGKTPAIRGVDLEVRSGEIVALTGESGSGKSTLLLALAGILDIDTGVIRYAGQDLSVLSRAARIALRRTDFGFVFQAGLLVPDLSVIDNVALPLMLSGSARATAGEQARFTLESLGVGALTERLPGDISGGESQRVAIARALVASPRVIFADEPTGSLDSRNGKIALGLLASAVRARGCTLLLVTHSRRVAAVADRELVMRDGVLKGGAS